MSNSVNASGSASGRADGTATARSARGRDGGCRRVAASLNRVDMKRKREEN
jgi:hypothetical protein